MSVGSTSLPQPGFYSSPSSLPTGLANGDAPASAPTSAQNPYQAAFANLKAYDTAELMSVSFGSAQNAESNVESVLAQAAALQQKSATVQQPVAPAIVVPTVPTLASIQASSNGNASSDLSNGTLGASIDATA